MKEKKPIKLDHRISLIDGFDMNMEVRTGTYVLNEPALTLIETGPSPSVKHIKKGLEKLGHTIEEVKYIIVTHVHLDHAGGAGLLMQQCPNAELIVHPRGARHLIDPTKLATGAKAIYGEKFSEIYDPIVPVPKERVITMTEGDTLEIGPDCKLEFWDTPGHAKHHISIYDPISNGIFTGDTVGIQYDLLLREGIELYLPSTSPNHFDPSAMHTSIQRVLEKKVDRVYFGHFGMSENPEKALNEVAEWLDHYMDTAKAAYEAGGGHQAIYKQIRNKVKTHLQKFNISDDHEVYTILDLDIRLSALGIEDYFQKTK